MHVRTTNFIEDERVPEDGRVVGYVPFEDRRLLKIGACPVVLDTPIGGAIISAECQVCTV